MLGMHREGRHVLAAGRRRSSSQLLTVFFVMGSMPSIGFRHGRGRMKRLRIPGITVRKFRGCDH